MTDGLRAQIYDTLNQKDTNELLDIWQQGDTAKWEEDTFDIVRAILEDRLGRVPPQSHRAQALQILKMVDRYLEDDELDKALAECEVAIQLAPDLATAYNFRGEIHEELSRLPEAITDYQKAVQLEPSLKVAWANLKIVEKELEGAFRESPAKQHLDRALESALHNEPEDALAEVELAKQSMPPIASAHNHLGVVLEELGQLEAALASYRHALRLNPRLSVALYNLESAEQRWQEQTLFAAVENAAEMEEGVAAEVEIDDFKDFPEDAPPIPEWMYKDEAARLLPGWPGYRTRLERSGWDPIDRNCETGHMQGFFIRRMFTGTLRTRHPIYLFLMGSLGIIFSLPLVGIVDVLAGDLDLYLKISFLIASLPYCFIGPALLLNVVLSLLPGDVPELAGHTIY